MKILLLTMILATTLTGGSIYDFKVPGLDGTDIDFSQYKGKKIMIVNTASKCGNTPQYKDLETLYEKYKDKLVIVGFPANNFGEQEPGTNADIKEFCTKNYGVTFPLAEKVSVRGDDIHPLFKYLNEESKELAKNVPVGNSKDIVWKRFLQDPVIWNFTKFLLDENGKLVAVFHHKSNPMSEEVLQYLK
ncbi:MAG TPA: glutathione peroxidase [Chitinophagaceae bacterium]|nr:glutathione peroxidase [Chitinophagaceae bacterium]HNU12837.1 glutathione peroxidase [Chitinophagaceae bacterium]